MLKGKHFLEYTSLFSRNEYKNSDKAILKCFQYNLSKLKCVLMFVINMKKLKKY